MSPGMLTFLFVICWVIYVVARVFAYPLIKSKQLKGWLLELIGFVMIPPLAIFGGALGIHVLYIIGGIFATAFLAVMLRFRTAALLGLQIIKKNDATKTDEDRKKEDS